MILLINEYGATISKDNLCIKVCKGEEERLISPSKLTAIHICKPCALSSPVLELAAEFKIPILIIGSTGKVKSRCAAPLHDNHATIRRHQVHFTEEVEGLKWMCLLLKDKVKHQVQNLRYLINRVKSSESELLKKIIKIEQKNINGVEPNIIALRSAEAQVGKLYWQAIAEGLKDYTEIKGRSKHPAKDDFNCVLNYLYGMLYGVVETACITSGLDAQLGILHTDDYLKPALVYDAIEPFRPWADKIAIDLFLGRKINDASVERTELACKLTSVGKKIVIPEFLKIMEERTYYNEKRIKRKDQIQHLLTSLAQFLLKQYRKSC